MTDIDLDALDALADAATPGPWRADAEQGDVFWDVPGSNMELTVAGAHTATENSEANAEYIAAVDPETVKTLIQRVRDAEDEQSPRNWTRVKAHGEAVREVEELKKRAARDEAFWSSLVDEACDQRDELQEKLDRLTKYTHGVDALLVKLEAENAELLEDLKVFGDRHVLGKTRKERDALQESVKKLDDNIAFLLSDAHRERDAAASMLQSARERADLQGYEADRLRALNNRLRGDAVRYARLCDALTALNGDWEADIAQWREMYGSTGWDGTPAPIAITAKHQRQLRELSKIFDSDGENDEQA